MSLSPGVSWGTMPPAIKYDHPLGGQHKGPPLEPPHRQGLTPLSDYRLQEYKTTLRAQGQRAVGHRD